jgi:hypothetical protein
MINMGQTETTVIHVYKCIRIAQDNEIIIINTFCSGLYIILVSNKFIHVINYTKYYWKK